METKHLKIVGILSNSKLKATEKVFGAIDSVSEIILICDYAEFDFLQGYSFHEILSSQGSQLCACEITLMIISQGYLIEYDMIPKGHKTVCKFKFANGRVPEVIFILPVLDGWSQKHGDEFLIFR